VGMTVFFVRKGRLTSNGLALCPNLHRAFDRGLIAIDPDNFKVKVSKQFAELDYSQYTIKQFKSKQILLPEDHCLQPSVENLQWHLNHFACNFQALFIQWYLVRLLILNVFKYLFDS